MGYPVCVSAPATFLLSFPSCHCHTMTLAPDCTLLYPFPSLSLLSFRCSPVHSSFSPLRSSDLVPSAVAIELARQRWRVHWWATLQSLRSVSQSAAALSPAIALQLLASPSGQRVGVLPQIAVSMVSWMLYFHCVAAHVLLCVHCRPLWWATSTPSRDRAFTPLSRSWKGECNATRATRKVYSRFPVQTSWCMQS